MLIHVDPISLTVLPIENNITFDLASCRCSLLSHPRILVARAPDGEPAHRPGASSGKEPTRNGIAQHGNMNNSPCLTRFIIYPYFIYCNYYSWLNQVEACRLISSNNLKTNVECCEAITLQDPKVPAVSQVVGKASQNSVSPCYAAALSLDGHCHFMFWHVISV